MAVDRQQSGGFPKLLWMKRQCPLCSSTEFQQAESLAMDYPFRVFSLQPVRCNNCWRRYYWFAKGARPAGIKAKQTKQKV